MLHIWHSSQEGSSDSSSVHTLYSRQFGLFIFCLTVFRAVIFFNSTRFAGDMTSIYCKCSHPVHMFASVKYKLSFLVMTDASPCSPSLLPAVSITRSTTSTTTVVTGLFMNPTPSFSARKLSGSRTCTVFVFSVFA